MNKYSIEALEKHVAKRRDVNQKHNLLRELGFVFEGTRYKHPSGKIIMWVMYEKMNFDALVSRLASLGFNLGSFNKAKEESA